MRLHPRDDEGSMVFALLVTVIGLSLSAVLTTVVIGQLSNSGYEARRVLALHAAQAGLDVGLAQVRTALTTDASTGATVGDRSQLPCTALTGAVDTAGGQSYSVTEAYYGTDPQGQSATWLAANAISCVAGSGPQYVPGYALFTSVGTAVQGTKSATRTLRGTYVFHTTNANISGGLVHVYRASSATKDLCIDAGSGSPAAGTLVTMQLCNSGALAQTWAYNASLQFVLIASQTQALPYGMCLEAGTTHAVNNQVAMQPCQSTTPSIYRQQWSYNDSSNLVGSKVADGSDTDGYCFNVQTADTVGSYIIITKTCGSSYNNVSTFSPDAKVGAGQASSSVGQAIGQLVNYNQFGRCLDDTGQNPNASYMIAWPCKQNPNAAKVAWNQRYTLPALASVSNVKLVGDAANTGTGTIYTTYTSTQVKYCLQSPLSTAYGSYVTTKVCVANQTNQQWTVYGNTGSYASSYQIVDSTGKYCLQPRDPSSSPADLFQTVNSISKIYVGACDGSTLQKWNADKNVIQALALKDVNEK